MTRRPPVRVLVCGGRDFDQSQMFSWVMGGVHAKRCIVELIHGCAPGADLMADHWGKQHNGVKVTPVPADWETHGTDAGAKQRDRMLALDPDGVVAFPGGQRTAAMVAAAKERQIPVLDALAMWERRGN